MGTMVIEISAEDMPEVPTGGLECSVLHRCVIRSLASLGSGRPQRMWTQHGDTLPLRTRCCARVTDINLPFQEATARSVLLYLAC
jgi:hypothetical protein